MCSQALIAGVGLDADTDAVIMGTSPHSIPDINNWPLPLRPLVTSNQSESQWRCDRLRRRLPLLCPCGLHDDSPDTPRASSTQPLPPPPSSAVVGYY